VRVRILIAAFAAVATLAIGASATIAVAKAPQLKVTDGDFGRILTNGKGRALYVFTSDHGSATCYDDCARAWPPYIVKSKPRAVGDVKKSKIGVTRRDDGRLQATYAGHPLYFYISDNEPGEVLCQAVYEFGGFWYVIRSSGRVVR
jgi:predicted lipoprotein with Yx(FWY)xxD motif